MLRMSVVLRVPAFTIVGILRVPAVASGGYFASLEARSGIQWPPITERAMKPVLRPVTVSYQSLMGTRVSVSLM